MKAYLELEQKPHTVDHCLTAAILNFLSHNEISVNGLHTDERITNIGTICYHIESYIQYIASNESVTSISSVLIKFRMC